MNHQILVKNILFSTRWKALGSNSSTSSTQVQLPRQLTWIVVLICILPFLLNLFGVDFASSHRILDFEAAAKMETHTLSDALHQTLAGSFTHTILEWSAFCAAIFTTILALAHFSIKRDFTTPVIGLALLCAGIMDAFHTLAADRLIHAVADNRNLIPFTWAICRLFNALIPIIGVSIFLVFKSKKWQINFTVIPLISFSFGLLSYSIIKICATSDSIPETTFPTSMITRPWDVAPLIIFILAGIFIYPKFYRQHPSVFAHSLAIATIPNAATQLHMAFGSTALFDNHFNIAHFLKIIAYLVPLAGLIVDYITTHRQLKETNRNFLNEIAQRKTVEHNLRNSKELLKQKNAEITQALSQLKTTQMQLIQKEKMASLGKLVGGMAHEINNPINFVYGNILHLEDYLQEMIDLIHVYQQEYPNQTSRVKETLEDIELEFIEEDLHNIFNSMRNGTNRIRDLVISLRNFSRLDEAELKEVDLHQGIDNTLLILKNQIENKITLRKQYGKLPLVECYSAQLNQVWLNLLSNAIDALKSDSDKKSSQRQITICTEVTSSDAVTVKIKDNGPGIPPDIQDKIFDPFFTTKPVGSGTGLGLAIAYQVIEQHHGQIDCNSEANRGTEFTISLPINFLSSALAENGCGQK